MRLSTVIARFLVPAPLVSAYCLVRFSARVSMRAEVELGSGLKLGPGTTISSFTKIKTSPGGVTIGRDVSIASGVFISAPVTIGDDCLIGPNVTIVATRYRYARIDVPMRAQGHVTRGVEIGRDVWLGAGCCVVDGVRIGNGVIVAPNSMVTGNIPDNAIVQGNPAKAIFTRR